MQAAVRWVLAVLVALVLAVQPAPPLAHTLSTAPLMTPSLACGLVLVVVRCNCSQPRPGTRPYACGVSISKAKASPCIPDGRIVLSATHGACLDVTRQQMGRHSMAVAVKCKMWDLQANQTRQVAGHDMPVSCLVPQPLALQLTCSSQAAGMALYGFGLAIEYPVRKRAPAEQYCAAAAAHSDGCRSARCTVAYHCDGLHNKSFRDVRDGPKNSRL